MNRPRAILATLFLFLSIVVAGPDASGADRFRPSAEIHRGDSPFHQDFLRYWRTMDEGYAYFIEKGIDWDEVFETYEPLVHSVLDVATFQLMIARITASLDDSHTWSSIYDVPLDRLPFRRSTGVCLGRMAKRIYIIRLTDEAWQAGLEVGDEVIQLDGEPVDAVLDRAKTWEGCSTSQCCDFYVLSHVDSYSAGVDAVVYTVLRDGWIWEHTVGRAGFAGGACAPAALSDFLEDAAGAVLKFKPIDDDLGYIGLSTLSDGAYERILQDLDAALCTFDGRRGIIFDARYNHGGSDLTAMAVLARFLDRFTLPVIFRYKNGPGHEDFTWWLPHPLIPRPNPVTTPVVFLMNGACVSAADFFVAAASTVPTFTLLGTPSCGGTGAPRNDYLPNSGITYTYSQMQRKYRCTGEQIEGNGIIPDILVEQDPEDLAGGLVTPLEAAKDFLR